MAVRDVKHVVWRPAVIKPMRPHTWHAAFGHLFDLVISKRLPFVDYDRVKPCVIRASAGRGVEKRNGFVQIVENGRVILEKRRHLISRQSQSHAQTVAVIIVSDVFAPIDQARSAFALIRFAVIVQIDHRVAAIDLERRCDHHDHVLPNGTDHRRVLDRDAIRHFHQHLRRTGLGRVDRPRRPIHGLALSNKLLCDLVINGTRVGELCRDLFVTGDLCEICLVRH